MMRDRLKFIFFLLAFVVLLYGRPGLLAKGRKDLTIYPKVQLNNVILDPGRYQVEVLENGGSSEVHIYKGKALVVKASAQGIKLDRKVSKTAVRYSVNGGDVPKLVELELAGEANTYKFQYDQK